MSGSGRTRSSPTLTTSKLCTTPSVRGSNETVAKLLRVVLSRILAARKKSSRTFCSGPPEQPMTNASVPVSTAYAVLRRRFMPAS